jgi:hypothetical protein
MHERIYPGAVQRLTCRIKTLTGAPIDPSTLTLTVKVLTTETVYIYGTDAAFVRDSVGRYHVDHLIAEAGKHVWRFVSTGVAAAAQEGYFKVEPSGI